LERQTKQRGRRNGDMSLVGLAVARALLLRFHNSANGLCFPSISKLAATASGFLACQSATWWRFAARRWGALAAFRFQVRFDLIAAADLLPSRLRFAAPDATHGMQSQRC
jgi:hypothetical protein